MAKDTMTPFKVIGMTIVLKENVNSQPIVDGQQAILVDLYVDLLANHTFYFTAVYFDAAIHLKYLISPPVPKNNYVTQKPFLWIDADVQDDLGSQYFFHGGAYGLWQFAPCTDGTLSFFPLPNKEAEVLSFTIRVKQQEEESEFTFSVFLEGYLP